MADLHGVIELDFLVWRGKLLLMGNKVNVPDSIVLLLFFNHSSKFAYYMRVSPNQTTFAYFMEIGEVLNQYRS